MTASNNERKNIINNFPHNLLKKLYLNSRVSIKQLEKEFDISHHTISKYFMHCENNFKLIYTLDVNTTQLGFSEARIIAVKFKTVPDSTLLKRVLKADPFVQNAYMAIGDFDLIMHVIASNEIEYSHWEYKFRIGFSRYKPRVKTSSINHIVEGFLPIQGKLLFKTSKLSIIEKRILAELIENSRIKLKDLIKKTKISQMKVIYTIKKLQEKNIIRQFTTTVQNPNKRIFSFYSVTTTPTKDHHPTLLLKLLKKIINEESNSNITTDYSVVCETSGFFDTIQFCNFKDGVVVTE